MTLPAAPTAFAPVRAIGIGGAILIAANGMVASGIFSLPGKLDAAVGMFAPVLLLLAGLGFVCIALSYTDCARHFERSGGLILYVGTAFGRFPGFIIGWLNYISRAAAQGANANVVVLTAVTLFPAAAGSVARQAMLVTLSVALTMLNVLGIRRAIGALAGITALKLIPLLVLMAAAFITFGTGHAPVIPPVVDAAGVALVALYAFTGFEVASLAAGETSNPRRALPIALVGTVVAIGLLYVLVQWAYSASGTPNSDAPLVSPRFATPLFSILFFDGFALLLALSGGFVFLAVVSTLARLLSYFACILAAPRLDRIFEVRRGWLRRLLFPGIAAALCIGAASQSKAVEWRTLALLVGRGVMLYWVARRASGPSDTVAPPR